MVMAGSIIQGTSMINRLRTAFLLFFATLTLSACEKKQNVFTIIEMISGGATVHADPTYRVLGAGQSNLANMDLTVFQGQAPDVLTTNNVAVGGSTLNEWEKGGDHYVNRLYHAFEVTNVPISAVLWWQGEAEGLGTPGTDASTWGPRFTKMIQDLRADVAANPPYNYGHSFKVILVRLGPAPQGVNSTLWNLVRDQQACICLPGVTSINVDDLPRLSASDVHYPISSYNTAARRLAGAYNETAFP